MSNNTWTGKDGSNFYDVANWQPSLPPEPGDLLNIAYGYADVPQGSTLDGMIINLGGANAGVAPITVERNGALDPTLELEDGSVIGASTTIQMPIPGRASSDDATVWTRGNVVNNGTIGLPYNSSNEPQEMHFVSYQDNSGEFINNGVINVPALQTSLFNGYPNTTYAASIHAEITNNGTINIYGTAEFSALLVEGRGTVKIGAISNNLGLPPTIGQFIFNTYQAGFEGGGTVAFAGGHLTLTHPFEFYEGIGASFSNFGENVGDEISLNNYTLTTESLNNNTLSLTGHVGNNSDEKWTMPFNDLPSAGQLAFTQDSSGLNITWAQPSPTPHPNPHPRPIPLPIPGPPGYHIS